MTREQPVVLYYRPELAPARLDGSFSKSPTKPRRFVEYLRGTPLWEHVEVRDGFGPVDRRLLLLAHTEGYVDAVLGGRRPLCESSGIPWTPGLRDAVLWTSGCLLAAIEGAVDAPDRVTMAPVSGFHHAAPDAGAGFCTFSGQVVAAVDLYRRRGLRGAWVDLDGHFGNSIEDSRAFAPAIEAAIAPGLNINPRYSHEQYLVDLRRQLGVLEAAVRDGRVDYVCVAHGADSHEWDDLGYQCTTAEWLEAADIVYGTLAELRSTRPLGVTLALFGGYRDDHPESVLGLHAMDLSRCLRHLGRVDVPFQTEVRRPRRA